MNSDIYNELTDSLQLILTPVEIECNEIISVLNDFIFTLCQYIHWRDLKLYVIKKDESIMD